MKISFIGSGRVASHLAQALYKSNQIVQIISPTLAHAQRLALVVDAEAIDQIAQLDTQIDLLVIAVSDQAIACCVQALAAIELDDVLLVHTSGSTAMQVFGAQFKHIGVFYPLQSFSFERAVDWSNTPFLLEAKQAEDLTVLKSLAESLSHKVYCYNSTQRLSLHLAAVFACNFTNYCYDAAAQLLDGAQVDFQLLYPLILETANKATQYPPQQMQTGPAVRRDHNILAMHQQLLDQAARPDLADLYQLMSEAIIERHSVDQSQK